GIETNYALDLDVYNYPGAGKDSVIVSRSGTNLKLRVNDSQVFLSTAQPISSLTVAASVDGIDVTINPVGLPVTVNGRTASDSLKVLGTQGSDTAVLKASVNDQGQFFSMLTVQGQAVNF